MNRFRGLGMGGLIAISVLGGSPCFAGIRAGSLPDPGPGDLGPNDPGTNPVAFRADNPLPITNIPNRLCPSSPTSGGGTGTESPATPDGGGKPTYAAPAIGYI